MRWYVGLVALLATTGAVELATPSPVSVAALLSLAAMLVALLLRSRWPLGGPVVAMAAFTVPLLATGDPMPALGEPPNSIGAAALLLVATYATGTHPSPLRAAVGLAAAEAVMLLHLWLVQTAASPGLNDVLAAAVVPTLLPWLAGVVVARQARVRAVEREADQLRVQAAEERARLAREVHDLVAHSVSLMVVQAEAGEALLSTSPSRTAESLRAVQEAGRAALKEMRQTVAALRGSDEGVPSRMAELPALLEAFRQAGLPITVVTEGDPVDLSPEVDVSLFHVLREALTNSLRHSDCRGVRVRLGYQSDRLELTVLDIGRPRSRRLSGGHGLTGLKERIQALGGELDVGPTSDGEHLLHARVPLAAR